jgi:RNA polymerase sigma factor (sigma-70 family)
MSEWRADIELLRAFSRQGDQRAFADVTRRHLDLVYATALRKVTDAGAAQEICQNVFTVLARKAWQFAPDDSLPSWLYRTTLLESKSWLRGELRRRRREQTAAELGTTMNTSNEQPAFNALVPLLDEALLSLRDKDRTALLLRYHESQSLRDVGASLGTSEDAARKRVSAAVEKLAQFFQRRGFKTATVSATAAAMQHTAASASAATASVVVNAALQSAPPALVGLGALLARVASLTKAQTALACLALAAVPVGWQASEHRHALAEADRIRTRLRESQNEAATIRAEIQRLTASVERYETARTKAEEQAARDADELRKFEEWKTKIRARLTASDYRWPEGSPFVRIPKSALKEVNAGTPVGPPGVLKPEARELLGLTPPEREQIEAALHKHFAAVDDLIESRIYETNKSRLNTGKSGMSVPASALASQVWVIPPLGEAVKARGDELLSGMESTLGAERWPLVETLLDSNGTHTLRSVLNLDAEKERLEIAVWIKHEGDNDLIGFGCAGPNGSYSHAGLSLKMFRPDATSETSSLELLGLTHFPESVTRRVMDWIQLQAATRLGKEAAR